MLIFGAHRAYKKMESAKTIEITEERIQIIKKFEDFLFNRNFCSSIRLTKDEEEIIFSFFKAGYNSPKLMFLVIKCGSEFFTFDVLNFLSTQNINNSYCGFTLLQYSVKRRSMLIVEKLIKKGADINQKNYDGKTAVTCSIELGFDEITFFLLRNGANPGIADKEGYNALHKACLHKRNDVVSFICKSRPELVNVRISSTGKTPMDLCDEKDINLRRVLSQSGGKKGSSLEDNSIFSSHDLASLTCFCLIRLPIFVLTGNTTLI